MERELLSWVGFALSLISMAAMIGTITWGKNNQNVNWWLHVVILCSYAILLAKNVFIGETFMWVLDAIVILLWFSSIRSLERRMKGEEEEY